MINTRIKFEREKLGISQAKLATILGFSQQTVGKWEKGVSEPDSETIKKLCKIFNCTANYLLDTWIPEKPTSELVSFERFSEILNQKGLSEKDIENLSKEQLSAIVDVIKNFK